MNVVQKIREFKEKIKAMSEEDFLTLLNEAGLEDCPAELESSLECTVKTSKKQIGRNVVCGTMFVSSLNVFVHSETIQVAEKGKPMKPVLAESESKYEEAA